MKLLNEIIDLMLEKASYQELFYVDNATELYTRDLTRLGQEAYTSVLRENKIRENDHLTYRLEISRDNLTNFCKHCGFIFFESKTTKELFYPLKENHLVYQWENDSDVLYINQLTKDGFREYLASSIFDVSLAKSLNKKEEETKLSKIINNTADRTITREDLYDLSEMYNVAYSKKWSTQRLIQKILNKSNIPYSDYSNLEVKEIKLDNQKIQLLLKGLLQIPVDSTIEEKEEESILPEEALTIVEITDTGIIMMKLSKLLMPIYCENPCNVFVKKMIFDFDEKRKLTAHAIVLIKNCKVQVEKRFADSIVIKQETEENEVSLFYDYKDGEWNLETAAD